LKRAAAVYLRVSTLDQHVETQLHDLKVLAESRGFQVIQVYEDRSSGARASRPGLDQLLADARRGKFEVVVVWACDRLARSVTHFLQVLDELWFKAHHENYDKAPSDFDTVKWNIEHTRQLRRLQLERRKLGERVFLQGENAIRLTLPSGVVLAGKPDLITLPSGAVVADKPDLITPPDGPPAALRLWRPTIYDVKTGRARCSDRIQVMLYMHLVPQVLPAYAGTRPAGSVVYNGSKVGIPPEAVDQKFIEAFEYFLDVIAGSEPAWKVPSCHECRFCDIARTECPERIED